MTRQGSLVGKRPCLLPFCLSIAIHWSVSKFLEENHQRDSQLFNTTTVCETALVTPSLFKIVILLIFRLKVDFFSP